MDRVMRAIRLLLVGVVVLAVGVGCRTRETRKSRHEGLDGGYVAREACDMPTATCYDKCAKRHASISCIGCCRDQEYLCDTGQEHTFDSCDSAP